MGSARRRQTACWRLIGAALLCLVALPAVGQDEPENAPQVFGPPAPKPGQGAVPPDGATAEELLRASQQPLPRPAPPADPVDPAPAPAAGRGEAFGPAAPGPRQIGLAADYVRHDRRTGHLTAEGDLRLYYDTFQIQGAWAEAWLPDDRLEVGGGVRVQHDSGSWFRTPSFQLDLTRSSYHASEGFIAQLAPSVVGHQAVEPINFVGRSLSGIRDHRFDASRAWLSGCPPEDRKYHLAASRIEVEPRRRAVLNNATAYLFGVPVFYWPKLTIPLRGYRQWDWFPEVGRSDVYGWFVRARYFYDLAETQYGNVSGMYTEKRGMFLGLEHEFGYGSAQFRGQGRIDTEYGAERSELSLRGSLSQQLGQATSLSLNGNFSQNSGFSTTTSQSNLTGRLAHQFGFGSTALGFSQSRTTTGAQESAFTRWTLNQRFAAGSLFDADLNADYSVRALTGSADDEELETRFRFQGRWTLFDWEITDNRRFDLEGSAFPGDDNRATTEVVPQLLLRTDSSRLGADLPRWMDVRLNTSLGAYREFITKPGTTERSRSTVARLNFDLSGRLGRFALGRTARFETDWQYSQSFFDQPNPAAKYIVAARPTWYWRPFDHLRFNVGYRWQEVAGYSPLTRFDFAQTLNDLAYGANIFVPDPARPRNGRLGLTVDGGYDILRGRHRDLRLQLSAQPVDRFSLRLNTSYAMDGQGNTTVGFRTVRAELVYDGGRRYQHSVGLLYDPNTGRFQNVDSLMIIEPVPHFTVQNALTWNGRLERVSFNDILATLDLGCLQIMGTYRQEAKEYRLDISLSAFPGLSSLFGTGRFGQVFSTSQGFQF